MDDESPLFLRRLLVGSMSNYVYLIGCNRTRECWVVDPAWDIPGILDLVEAEGFRVTGALVTHYHPDHVGGEIFGHKITGLAELLQKISVPIHVQRKELAGVAATSGISSRDLVGHDPGDELAVGEVNVKLLHTPGHTPGSQCFLVGNNLISGDTLFIQGCGRVDLPGGDPEAMYRSLNEVLKRLPENTRVYPGHQYGSVLDSTIGEEARNNPYLQFQSVSEFLRAMGYGPG